MILRFAGQIFIILILFCEPLVLNASGAANAATICPAFLFVTWDYDAVSACPVYLNNMATPFLFRRFLCCLLSRVFSQACSVLHTGVLQRHKVDRF